MPLRYNCVVAPSPCWMAALLPARADEGGGLLALLSLPAAARYAAVRSRVLAELAPGAEWAGLGQPYP